MEVDFTMFVKITELQGLPHTLTQTDGKTFRLFARKSKVINEDLVSEGFYKSQARGYILIEPVEEPNSKEGGK